MRRERSRIATVAETKRVSAGTAVTHSIGDMETAHQRLFEQLDAAAINLANLLAARSRDRDEEKRLRAEVKRINGEIQRVEVQMMRGYA